MRYCRIRIVSIVFMIMVGFLPAASAATVSEKESLRGLSGIVLRPMVFVSTPAKVKDELPLTDLMVDIQETLQQSGMLLDTANRESVGERPFLEIQGAVAQIAANYYAYTIVVELHQQATLMRNSTSPTLVTWSEGTLSTGNIQNFEKRIRLLVRMFIKDFQNMNAPRSPAWSLSWTPSES